MADTVEERCLHEMLSGQCAICLRRKTPEQEALELRARLLTKPHWFAGSYAGNCGCCGERFPAGAAIRMEVGRYRAECCGEDGGDGRG